MKSSASDDGVMCWAGSRSSPRIASPRGVPPGSRSGSTSFPFARSASESRRSCVVLPAPSDPSSTISRPGIRRSGERYDGAGRALLHAVHDPVVHLVHDLVEVLLRRDRALINRVRLNLGEQIVKLFFHLSRWL